MPKGIRFRPQLGTGDEQSLADSLGENSEENQQNQGTATTATTASAKFRSVSLKFKITEASNKLHAKWLARPENVSTWSVSLGNNLPRLQVVQIEEIEKKALMVTVIVPISVYNKIRSWGNTECSSVLIATEFKTSVIWGIIYTRAKTKIAVQWFLAAVALSILASIGHVILVWVLPELPHTWSLILVLFALTVEPGPYILFWTREFQFWFSAWKIAMIVDLLAKVIAVFLEFSDIVQTFVHPATSEDDDDYDDYGINTHGDSDLLYKHPVKLNVITTIAGLISTIITVLLFRLTIKVKQAIRDEDQASRILTCTERPRKIFCSKPFVLWAVGRTYK